MADLRDTIRAAQRGQPMVEFFAPAAPVYTELGLGAVERLQVVETFIDLIEGLYVHLPLKRAMYGKDPVQRLRVLRQRAVDLGEADFHAQLASNCSGGTACRSPGRWTGTRIGKPAGGRTAAGRGRSSP